MKKPKKKYVVGALAAVMVVGAAEGIRRIRNWKYWENQSRKYRGPDKV